jgi:hypothetical protein
MVYQVYCTVYLMMCQVYCVSEGVSSVLNILGCMKGSVYLRDKCTVYLRLYQVYCTS